MNSAETPTASIRRALLSVSDKTGLVELAQVLAAAGIELLSTGGTARLLREAGLVVVDVAEVTGVAEMMDGRVKTLHPHIHGAILARRGIDDNSLNAFGIEPIDLVVINLYPFREAIADHPNDRELAIENIDIGGPAMLRAAAKNARHVTAVARTGDYELVAEHIRASGVVPLEVRERLAATAFALTAAYDQAIANHLAGLQRAGAGADASADKMVLPSSLSLHLERTEVLRYGENAHQRAALYRTGIGVGIVDARQLQGKQLSYNNIADADTAIACVMAFDVPGCVIVKHANPCGVALGESALEAYELAFATDPTSAFGGIIAFNRALDAATVRRVIENQFVEVLISPDISRAALDAVAVKPAVRLLEYPSAIPQSPNQLMLRSVSGGYLVQDCDSGALGAAHFQQVSARAPTADELCDLAFAWRVVKYVKSNAIVYARNSRTLGIGAGQMSRVYSARIAALKAGEAELPLAGAVMASDAFFPFRDGIDTATEAGITAVVQPGGSIRDKDVIAAADEADIAMVFTGMRHFLH